MPPLGGIVEERAAAFQHKANAFVHQDALGGMSMAIGRHLNGPEVTHEFLGMAGVEMRGMFDGPLLEKAQEVVGGGAVAMNGLHRRAEDLLMMLEPMVA